MIVGVLLAAGKSTRFGSDKLLHRLPSGEPLAITAARTLIHLVDDTVVVVRPEQSSLAARLADLGFNVLFCEAARAGMGYSLAAGVGATPQAGAWIVTLADMPWIQLQTVAAVVQALRSGAALASPTYHGRRGHPVGFSSVFRAPLMALRGDHGARTLLDAYADSLQKIPCNDPGAVADVDQPGDLSTAWVEHGPAWR